MTRGALTARFAVLVSEFKLTLPQIYDLTPRQIEEIYFHPRDPDGGIKAPSEAAVPADPVAKLQQLLGLAAALKLPAEQVEKIKQRIEAATPSGPGGRARTPEPLRPPGSFETANNGDPAG